MKIDLLTPGADMLLVTLDGEVMGYLEEADTEQGYVLQRQITCEADGSMTYGDLVRKEGRVDILGNILVTETAEMQRRMSSLNDQLHRNAIWSNWTPRQS